MCDEAEVMFYGMNLWTYYDNAISTNSLSFDYYAYSKNDRLASPKFKIGIYGKAAEGSKINLDSSNLYKFTYQLKQKILNSVKDAVNHFKSDQSYTTGFSYNTGYGKNIYVTLMWSPLSNNAVIRFMIGEKEQTILESDKVYIPIIEFFSFCEILDQAFKNYITLCSTVVQENSIRKLHDMIDCKDFGGNPSQTSFQEVKEIVSINPDNLLSENKENDTISTEQSQIIENVAKTSDEKENNSEHQDFDNFLKENRDQMELDMAVPIDQLVAESKGEKVDPIPSNVQEIIVTSKFIDKVCNNDFSKLEQLILNGSNEDLPFDSFVNIVKQFSDIDFKDGINNTDYLAVNYAISRQIKTRVGMLIEKQIKLPISTAPVIIKNDNRSDDKLDASYYLLLFYIYTSKLRTALSLKTNNSIDNKDLFTYLLKMITSPMVFSYIPDTKIEVTKSEVKRRYDNLIKNGFFNSFINNLKVKVPDNFITIGDIEESIDKIYLNVSKFQNKLTPKVLFDSQFMKMTYDDFIKNSDLIIDHIKKIIRFDSSLFKFKKIDLTALNINSTDDLPVWVTNLFGIKTTKFDTTIIRKYFDEFYKGNDQLEHISKINKNVYDIIDLIDLDKFDDNALKALYFWDIDELPKTLTYPQFKKMINNSSLERNQLISMIINREKVVDPTFFASFLVSAEDPFEL